MSGKSIKYSIVVPVYNSAATLDILFSEVKRIFNSNNLFFELIFVDDFSRDNSWKIISKLRNENPDCITAVRLSRNFGQNNAIMCGLRHSCGDYVFTIDDDLQIPPEEMLKLIECQRINNSELVYGVQEKKMHNSMKNFGSWVVQKIFRSIFQNDKNITSFRLLSRNLVNKISSYKECSFFIDGVLHWHVSSINYVLTRHNRREIGKSGYVIRKQIQLFFDLFFGFSTFPLYFVFCLGFLISVISFCIDISLAYKNLSIGVSLPYSFFFNIVLFMFGLLLLTLAIIGRYLIRLYFLFNDKPAYVISEIHTDRSSKAKAIYSD